MTASFPWTGHGSMDSGTAGIIHLIADQLHLLSAGIWIGALLPLCILVSRSMRSQSLIDVRAAQFGLERFSAIGISVVAVLVLSGIVNSWFLIGWSHWRALFTTLYGIVLVVKLLLFFTMLVLAALNRLRMLPALRLAVNTPRLAQPILRTLQTSILAETALALLVLLVVGLLGTLSPPISGE